MAGTYPDVPGLRMAYDRDGSVGFSVNITGGSVSSLSAAQLAELNDEDSGGIFLHDVGNTFRDHAYGVIFPELRDLAGWVGSHYGWGSSAGDGGGWLEYSMNTTNGLDGTWTAIGGSAAGYRGTTVGASPDLTVTELRTNIFAATVAGVKAVRVRRQSGGSFGANSWFACVLHLFGKPAAGENPHRLRFWQSAVDAEVTPAHFDLGDVARGTSNVVAFRIKNDSFSKTAYGVTVLAAAPTDTAPSNVSQHTFSLDGSIYTPTLNIGTLTPGEISGIVYMRRDTSPSAALSVWWTRFIASATSWT